MGLWFYFPGLSCCVIPQSVIHTFLGPFQKVVLCHLTALYNTGMEFIKIHVSGSPERTQDGINRKLNQRAYLQRAIIQLLPME